MKCIQLNTVFGFFRFTHITSVIKPFIALLIKNIIIYVFFEYFDLDNEEGSAICLILFLSRPKIRGTVAKYK